MVKVLGGRVHTTGRWSWLLKKRDRVRSGPLKYTLCRVEAYSADIHTRRGSEQKSIETVLQAVCHHCKYCHVLGPEVTSFDEIRVNRLLACLSASKS